MHLAAPITAHPIPPSPASYAAVNVQGNSTSAAGHFGDLVCERAGAIRVVTREAAPATTGETELLASSDLQARSKSNSGASSELKTDQPLTAYSQSEPSGFSSVHALLQAEGQSISAHMSLSHSAEGTTLLGENSRQTDSSAFQGDSTAQAMNSTSSPRIMSAERKTRKHPEPPDQIAATPVSSAGQQPSSLAVVAIAPMQPPLRSIAAAGIPPVANNTPSTKATDPAALAVKPDMAAQATDSPSASGDRPASQSTTSAPMPAGQSSTNPSLPSGPASVDATPALGSSLHSLLSDPNSSSAAHSAAAAEQPHTAATSAILATPSPGNYHLLDNGVAVSAHAGQSVSGAIAAAVSPAPPAPASPNVYDKLEQASTPVLLHSGAQHVAVGVRDPNLGWVEIKAQNTAGRVDATLVTSSNQVHASLAAQLPAITQYLVQRDVRVGSLAVHHQSPGTSPGGAGADNGPNAQSHSGSGNAANEDRERPYSAGLSLGRLLSVPVAATGEDSPLFRPVTYISVRA